MQLRLQNFQSHVNSTVEFAPVGQLTILVGPTDSGKTSILRAWRAVAYNEFPVEFIRVGANSARVTVTLDDGTQIIRERSRGGVNRYILARPNEKPLTFEGFGTGVPAEIRQALGAHELQIGDLTIRPGLAEQLDGPFLGRSVPATARAKVLGALAGVEEVDAANKTTGTDLYRAAREVERLEAEIKANAAAQAGLAWVEPFGQSLEILTALHAAAQAAEDRRAKLITLAARVAQNATETARIQATLARLAVLPAAAAKVAEGTATADRAGRLAALAAKIQSNRSAADATAADIARLARVAEAAGAVARLAESTTRAAQLRRVADALRDSEVQRARIDAVLSTRPAVARAVELVAAANAAATRGAALSTLAARLARVTAGTEEVRQAAILAENNLAEARAAYADAMASATVTCPRCGYEFTPENLKEVA